MRASASQTVAFVTCSTSPTKRMDNTEQMMSTQHTPTPWQATDSGYIVTSDAARLVVAVCRQNNANDVDESPAVNAAHIVRCVNAWDDVEALRARINELVSK